MLFKLLGKLEKKQTKNPVYKCISTDVSVLMLVR